MALFVANVTIPVGQVGRMNGTEARYSIGLFSLAVQHRQSMFFEESGMTLIYLQLYVAYLILNDYI